MKTTGIMKNKMWITGILLIGMLLSSCGAGNNLAGLINGSTATVTAGSSQTENLAKATETAQNDGSSNQTNTVQATPVQPVVINDGSLAGYQDALTQIYEGVNPSVVSIIATSSQGEGQGSGFVWDLQGHIVTNNHVIDGAKKVTVEFYDGTRVNAEVVGADVYSDLAVLKVDISEDFLQPVQMADSDAVKVGQLAIAIGNPFALSNTMTVGIVSAIGRSITAGEINPFGSAYSIPDIIQTDAPINPGNSGGVLVNDSGQVIGVTNAIESTTNSNAGIGFAIPSNIVTMVVPGLIENGSYDHPYLGITGSDLYPDLAKSMGLDPEQRGALVIQVTANGPADKAGVRGSDSEITVDGEQVSTGGDVITAIDGEKVLTMDDLIAYLFSKTHVGQTVTLTLLRDGEEKTVDVTLEARPAQESTITPLVSQIGGGAYLGITGIDMTSQIAEAMELSADQTGVLVQQVRQGSPADEAGLRGGTSEITIDNETILIGGDVITGIDKQTITSFKELSGYIRSANPGEKVTLEFLRDGKTNELEVTLGFVQ
ncbi:MAG: PDZ domain-containing protein [Chloroflexi bacterium]|nr:PDZ domain-containing protein [Chloroflexota bacterium]